MFFSGTSVILMRLFCFSSTCALATIVVVTWDASIVDPILVNIVIVGNVKSKGVIF